MSPKKQLHLKCWGPEFYLTLALSLLLLNPRLPMKLQQLWFGNFPNLGSTYLGHLFVSKGCLIVMPSPLVLCAMG